MANGEQFDRVINRRNTNSLKWDVPLGELPMWVADMDFKTAPAVIDAVTSKAKSGVYGYQIVPDEWYDAYVKWWKTRHDFAIDNDWLCFCTGVVPAITSVVKRLTNVGDNVAVMTPVYNIFFHSIENTGRHTLECPFTYKGGKYSINFADLEAKLAEPLTTMLILCNPHNPIGRVFSKAELVRIGKLCKKYGVTVLADEIHCDLTEPGVSYTPFASAAEVCRDISVTAISPSKAFNLAGLQTAAVVVPNEQLRNAVVRGLNSDELAEPNAFAVEAAIAAFNDGGQWLDALRTYVADNRKCVAEFLEKHLPQLKLVPQDATYLLWIDCSAITDDAESLCSFIRSETGLYLNVGNQYRGNGNYFVRLNVACPRSQLRAGLNRLKRGVKSFINK